MLKAQMMQTLSRDCKKNVQEHQNLFPDYGPQEEAQPNLPWRWSLRQTPRKLEMAESDVQSPDNLWTKCQALELQRIFSDLIHELRRMSSIKIIYDYFRSNSVIDIIATNEGFVLLT